jgi:hypothetical protein
MKKKGSGSTNSDHENSSLFLLSGTTNDTVLRSKTPLQKPVMGKNLSISVHSIPPSKALRRKDLSLLNRARKFPQSAVIANGNIFDSPTKGKLSWKTFLPFKRDCCLGVTSDCYRLITTRFVVEPIAYLLLPLDVGEAWMGDLCEKRLRMWNSGYHTWVIHLYDILWSADLAYRSLAEHIKILWH